MDIIIGVLVIVFIMIIMYCMYKMGKSNGVHEERIRVYDMIGKIPEGLGMDNLSVDEKFNVRVVIGYMLGKIHEG